jgi:hypothetical protein
MNKILSSLGLAVLGIAILVGAAGAVDDATGATSITGSYPEAISVSAPSDITSWILSQQNDNIYSSSSLPTATISSNIAGSVYLKVKDARTGFPEGLLAGHMTNHATLSSATKQLSGAMTIKANTGTEQTLSGTATTIYTLTSPDSATPSITFSQDVAATDSAGTYYITVTFIGTTTA